MQQLTNRSTPWSNLARLAAFALIAGSAVAQEGQAPPADPWSHLGYVWTDAGDQAAYLGVQIEEATEPSAAGARVTEIVEDSPAERAGLRVGDLIQRFDGHVIRGPVGLTERIHAKRPNDGVEIVVLRNGEPVALTAKLGRRSGGLAYLEPLRDLQFLEDADRAADRVRALDKLKIVAPGHELFGLMRGGRPRLGVQLVETTPELRGHLGGDEAHGVLVSKVLPGTPAQHAGVRVGDLILGVAGRPVKSSDDLVEALRGREGKVLIEVAREGKKVAIEVTFPESDDDVPTGPRAALAPSPPLPS